MTSREQALLDNISGPFPVTAYPLSNLPKASDYYHTERFWIIGVQATGGTTICVSDGSTWIDLQTGSTVA